MPQTYPFTRANPTDWSPGQRLSSAQANTMDKNAAQAADGLLWSDVAVLKNWVKSTIANSGNGVVWEPTTRRWFTAGSTGGNQPVVLCSHDGFDDWISITIATSVSWDQTASMVTNGTGTILIGGGGASGSTTSKIRQSVDGGETWSTRSTVANGTQTVRTLTWHSGASLFVAGLSSTATTNIETSPDGATWTQRTAPNSNARSRGASNGNVVVLLSSGVSTNKCVYSSDGVTWAEATLPATGNWTAIHWSSQSGIFMAIGLGLIATSTDGVTWTSSGLTAPHSTSVGDIRAFGRVWLSVGSSSGTMGFVVRTSLDSGVSWQTQKSIGASVVTYRLSHGEQQLMLVGANAVAYATFHGGQ